MDSLILTELNFNTSHVTVYHFIPRWTVCNTSISIHLMLLFIHYQSWNYHTFLYFNTSHVTVYRRENGFMVRDTGISIHLMLLFIHPDFPQAILTILISIHLMLLFICVKFVLHVYYFSFQYISCYCLSSPQLAGGLRKEYFNTSHVTVYHICLHQISIGW